ncbi:MAG: hypothetical protein PHN42_00760 [Bacilli bacterium]|nr:hypothetical protein [Bacilli bacterium]
MNYKQIQEKVSSGGNKVKIFGFIFLLVGVFILFTICFSSLNWNMKKSNYEKQYISTNNKLLTYEKENQIIYIEKIYNIYNEQISLSLPSNKTAISYCEKNDPTKCIYFDMNNSMEQAILDPIKYIFVSIFLISIGVFFISTVKHKNNPNTTLNPIFLFSLILFLIGIAIFMYQINLAIKFLNLKSQNNVVDAKIYSEIYNISRNNNMYKPVAEYYVNNQKYIYVSSLYISGTLYKDMNKSIKLYYDIDNPSNALENKNPIDIPLFIISLFFIIITFPVIFMKKQLEKKHNKN